MALNVGEGYAPVDTGHDIPLSELAADQCVTGQGDPSEGPDEDVTSPVQPEEHRYFGIEEVPAPSTRPRSNPRDERLPVRVKPVKKAAEMQTD